MSTVHRSRRIRIYHVLCVVIYLSSVGDDRWSESWLCYIIQTITIIPIIYVFSCLRWEYNKCINLTKNERERERETKSESNLLGRTKKTRDLNAYAYDIHAYRQFTIFAIDKKKRVWSKWCSKGILLVISSWSRPLIFHQ